MDKLEKIAATLFVHKNPGRSWVTDLREDGKEEWRAQARAVIDALVTDKAPHKPPPEK